MESFIVSSVEQTQEIALLIGQKIKPNSVITLTGDLGAGKTTFTKGLAQGLGIKERISSPTFTILKIYESGRLPLYHFDAYRLENGYEDLGFEEYIDDQGVSVIEWPIYMEETLPKERLEIEILNIDEHTRQLILKPEGEKYHQLCKEVLECMQL
ncbi:MAG: tRNA (adenosine(37)-N6)-threonylcarbamoyltransferase complex ATPase subunit type 1 TsaE [Beduini sp.]